MGEVVEREEEWRVRIGAAKPGASTASHIAPASPMRSVDLRDREV
jgi:hypothetical protein